MNINNNNNNGDEVNSCPFEPSDVVVYGPMMTPNGFIYKPLIIHSRDISKTYYPVKSQLKQLKPGLCIVSSRVNSGDKFDTLSIANVKCRDACAEELMYALKKNKIIPDLIKPSSIRLYKCWNKEHDDFIYMAMTEVNVFYHPYDTTNVSVMEAFKGLDPNREGAYPYHPKAIVLIKRNFGDTKVVKTSKYSLPFLYNKYPIGEPVSTTITDDMLIDRLLMADTFGGEYPMASYINTLANVNRNEEFTEKPQVWAIRGRLVMRTHTKGCYIVYRNEDHIHHSYLCPSNQFKHLCELMRDMGIEPVKLKGAMSIIDALCIESERRQCDRLNPTEIIKAIPNASVPLRQYIESDIIQGYKTSNGKIQLKFNWLYKTRNPIARVKRVFPEIDAYHASLGLNIPMWYSDMLMSE